MEDLKELLLLALDCSFLAHEGSGDCSLEDFSCDIEKW